MPLSTCQFCHRSAVVRIWMVLGFLEEGGSSHLFLCALAAGYLRLCEKGLSLACLEETLKTGGRPAFKCQTKIKRCVQSINKRTNEQQPTNQSLNHSMTQSLKNTAGATPNIHSITQSPNHSITQSPNHPITQSLDHSITQSLHHSITQSPNQSLNHPITQSLTHSTNQSLRPTSNQAS